MEQRSNAWRTALICGLLVSLSLLVFWSVVHNQFIGYDDPEYVTDNPHVLHGLTWANVLWSFRLGEAGNWHPLTWLSHMADVSLFGLKPGWHHLVSLLLHVSSTLLLFAVFKMATGAAWRSAAVAALFALHPLHVESVAWAAERKDVLSGFFFMLMLWAYYRHASCDVRETQPKKSQNARGAPAKPFPIRHSTPSRWYLLALLFFALGLMSKPMLVTVPFVLLLVDYWPLRRAPLWEKDHRAGIKFLLFEKIPFLILALGSCIVTFLAQSKGSTMSSLTDLSFTERIANAITSYLCYLGKTVWPIGLSVFYPHPANKHLGLQPLPAWQVFAALLVLVLVTLLAWRKRKSAPWFLTGWLWYLGMLVPVIGFVQVGGQAMADRYTYLPLIGIFMLGVWGLAQLAATWRVGALGVGVIGAAVMAGFALTTRQQVSYWKDDFSLFGHAAALNDKNAPAHTGLAAAYGRQRKYGQAQVHARAAVQADPSYAAAWRVMGDVADALEKPQEAMVYFERTLRIDPNLANAWFQLGYVNAKMGRLDEAAKHYQTALRLRPDFVSAHNNLATVLWDLGKREEALQEFAIAVRLSPESPEKRYNLGTTLAEAGRAQEAKAELTAALRLRPNYYQAHRDFGLLLAQQKEFSEAVVHLEEALRLNPGPEAHYYLGLILGMQGNYRDAIAHYRQTLSSKPDAPAALNDLAWILATAPQPEFRNGPEAVRMAERAVQLTQGRNARYLGTLDAAYAESGRFDEAIAAAERTREAAIAVGDKNVAEAAEKRAALYKAGQPFRQ